MDIGKNRSRILWSLAVLVPLGLAAWGGVAYWKGKPKARRGAGRPGRISEALEQLTGGPRGLASIQLPPGFTAELAAKPGLVTYPMFVSFDDQGRMFVCESAGKNLSDDEMQAAPEMRIRMIEDTDGDGVYDRGTIFADKLTMAMGAQWYRGSLYVAAPPDILRLQDADGDGVAERREAVLTGWPLHSNGTTFHGPYLGPDGWMYFTYNLGHYRIRTKEGAFLEGPGGRVWRCRPDGTGLEWFVGGGFDNGIEIVFTAAGETLATMTYYQNPKMGLRDALLHFVEGGVYPKVLPIVHKYKRTGELMPAMTKFARIAPAGLLLYRGPSFGAAYQGNLFSAQFNPHRIQRHILERDGATFRTRDEDFLVSTDPDFHPTDVAEDADGSLIVVETGAWYLHSCPVSRIAKPQVKGALYRVRRQDAPPAADPWGRSLGMEKLPPAELVQLLQDGRRPSVRDKAAELLVDAGEAAVEPLVKLRRSHPSAEARVAAVFALGRIGKGQAAEAVRAGLSDEHFLVRVAAARMVGLAKDREAVARLTEMVKRDEPAARRQAATALGQIGDAGAVPALLAAAANPDDRFVEHSIIYSLITLGKSEPLVEALQHPSPRVRQAALIALDQMGEGRLERRRLGPALGDSDVRLRRAAMWIVSRHPDWSGELAPLLGAGRRSEEDQAALRDALVAVCGDSSAQQMLAGAMEAGGQTMFLLEVLEQCQVKEFPPAWVEALRSGLAGRDHEARARVVALVRTRQLAGLDESLERIASSQAESADLRALALAGLVSRRAELAEPHFRFLLDLLRPETGADLRLSAAQVLGRARLSEPQLVVLAGKPLAQADPLILPSLLDAFRPARSEQTGRALVEGLLASPHPVDGMAAERIPEMLKSFPAAVGAAARPLLERIQKATDSRADRLKVLEPLLEGGDPDRGRQVFFGKKAGCASCHTIMAEGGDAGPDLTGVGAIRSGIDLLEAIVFPSASFVPGHEVFRVETAREVHTGVQGESNPEYVTIISGPRERVRVPRKEVVSMRPAAVSLMPDGFADDLTREELSNLLAFLQAQRYRESGATGRGGDGARGR